MDLFMQNRNAVKKLQDLMPVVEKRTMAKRKHNRGIGIRWDKIVGEEISRHTEFEGIKGDTIFVWVDSAVWLHYITAFKKEELLKDVQSEYKSKFISDIKFRVRN
jgi:predicted nucleic acid-binding Zn ribbon protein